MTTKDTATDLDALKKSGLELFPLRSRSKRPRDKGWMTADYSDFNAEQHLKGGGNIGARLKPGQAVLDVDPRNGGDLGLYALDLDLGDALARAPVMETGGGGLHYHFTVPDDERLVGKLKGYPGIDVKAHGGYVVVAGIHPDTGKPYRVKRGFGRSIPAASGPLLKMLARPAPTPSAATEHGVASANELAVLLGALDPCDYGAGHHDRFVQMMAACHDATRGEGKEEFLAWAAGDPDYGDAAYEQNAYRWESFESGKPGGATYKTLLGAVADAGRRDLVAQFDSADAADDFDDEEVEGDEAVPRRKAGLTIVAADSVEQRNIDWLWPSRIALGKLTGIAGPPDQGKSQVTASIAAMVSTGGRWPDGGEAPLGAVLMLSAEDDPADTTVPRLAAAGADLSKVHLVEALVTLKDGKRMFSMKDDLPRLEAALEAVPGVRLIIVDPISAYMGAGSVDTFKNSDVRGVLAPLADLAAKAGIAVLFVSHFNKGGSGAAINRVTDSLAFTALARSFWAVVPEKEDGVETGRKLMVRIKQNIAAPVGGLAYEIEGVTLENGVTTSRVHWHEGVEMTADEVFAAQEGYVAAPKRDEASSFLLTVLEDGPMESTELIKRAAEQGISEATLRRAKANLPVRTFKGGKAWFVELIEEDAQHRGADEAADARLPLEG